MQIICEGHPQIVDLSPGLQFVLHHPTVLDEPVLEGESDVDAAGAFYSSVFRDAGVFRMWYQTWPRGRDGSNTFTVACAESDDGLHWRRPGCNLVEAFGTRNNPLTDLPFHSPSVFADPDARPPARYRAFGYCDPRRITVGTAPALNRPGYFTAHSADGLHWEIDSAEPLWPWADVITSAYDPTYHRALVAMKRWRRSAGMDRRAFMTAEWSAGQATQGVTALVPDEYDDLQARGRGFNSADYYGLGLMPTEGPTIGFLWNFRHQLPLGVFGDIGRVDLSIVYQLERHGKWHHFPGRPDWLSAEDAPDWANCLYTAAYPIDVGDETWLYFCGTLDFHGWCGDGVKYEEWIKTSGERKGSARIGLIKWPKNRIMGYKSVHIERMRLVPRRDKSPQGNLILNAVTRPGGALRAELLDPQNQPIPGYTFSECEPIRGDHLEIPVRWKEHPSLPRFPADQPIMARLELTDAILYAFDFTLPGLV